MEVRAASPKGLELNQAMIDKWDKAAQQAEENESNLAVCHKALRHTDEELEQRIANLEKNSADFASK